MKRTIELIMPVMRPDSALKVMEDLKSQTWLIDKLTIVDNGGDFKLKGDFPFEIKIIRPKKNIGTNAAWNKMWSSKANVVGVIGDDYQLEERVIEILNKAIDRFPMAGGFTATIYRDRPVPKSDHPDIKAGKIHGYGRCAVTLFERSTLNMFPKIPKELFIFFGDNWLGYWLNERLSRPLYEVSVGVSHYHSTDLKHRLDYPAVIRKEKHIWEDWKAGKRKLGGVSHE